NIKPCAAGRLSQKEGYEFSLSNIKENDIMAFGFDEFDQCVEDGKILEEILGK
ncbi:MAG: hypothetical protein GY870_02125, partial [archaeon]|nr:hypothetical protein [archaeon]